MPNTFSEFIRPELLILVPVLYFIGRFLKGSKSFDDRHIPLMLGIISIALCIIEILAVSNITSFHSALSAVFTAITQGLLCAGCSVYTHQIFKQLSCPKCTNQEADADKGADAAPSTV